MNLKILLSLGLFVVLIGVVIAGCAEPSQPEPTLTPTPTPTPTPTATPELKTIVETAVAAGDFTTLVTAVQAAGLAETLNGTGPFTVFAPTDDAFAALPEGTLDSLLADPEGELKDILLYHVVAGRLMATDVVASDSIETLEGTALNITSTADGVFVDGANIIITDIECSNGIIHVIDAVMLPPEA